MDFDALADHHKDAVYRQMIRICGNREDAEDVLIEALLPLVQLLALEDEGRQIAQAGEAVDAQVRRAGHFAGGHEVAP